MILSAIAMAAALSAAGPDPFVAADLNRDGFLQRSEFTAARAASARRRDANGDGVLSGAELPQAASLSGGLASADANGDGALSLAELAAAPTPVFDRLDRDRDGRLSRREAGRALSALR